ncbi:hypothetical protein GCM10010254_26100 [Streptomyces chromofuscus]|nr:hypothetical protein GCM10010254_26100 [Streptomyces chromofuscus]
MKAQTAQSNQARFKNVGNTFMTPSWRESRSCGTALLTPVSALNVTTPQKQCQTATRENRLADHATTAAFGGFVDGVWVGHFPEGVVGGGGPDGRIVVDEACQRCRQGFACPARWRATPSLYRSGAVDSAVVRGGDDSRSDCGDRSPAEATAQ